MNFEIIVMTDKLKRQLQLPNYHEHHRHMVLVFFVVVMLSLSRQARFSLRVSLLCAAKRGGVCHAYPRLRPSALSGVNCTACVAPLRGLETVSTSFCPTLTCGVIRMTCFRHLVYGCCDTTALQGTACAYIMRLLTHSMRPYT